MAEGRQDAQITLVLETLRELLRARGIRYRDIAEALTVSQRTVKRWFAGDTVALQTILELCRLVDVTFIELCDLARDAAGGGHQYLTLEQEQGLFAVPNLGFVFVFLLNGWSPPELQVAAQIPEATLVSMLVRLEKLRLIDLLPGNKVRLLTARNIEWRRDGPAVRAFERNMKHLFATMDLSDPKALWQSEIGYFSRASIAQIDEKIRALQLDIRQLSEADRHVPAADKSWYVVLLAARPFDLPPVAALPASQPKRGGGA